MVERNRSVDALRGIAIALVVLGHINRGILEGRSGTWQGILQQLDFSLYSVHMPVFFYLAGYFTYQSLKKRTPTEFIKSRWAAIVYPYLFWSAATVAAHYGLSSVIHINHPVTFYALSQIGWAPINILWFLYALLCMQLTGIVSRHYPYLLLAVALTFSLLTTLLAAFLQGNIVGKVAVHFPFFAVGFTLASAGLAPIPRLLEKFHFAMLASVVWIGGCLSAYWYGINSPTNFVLLPISITGIACLASVSSILVQSEKPSIGRHLVKLGELSLPIYLLHSFILAVTPRLLGIVGVHWPPAELASGLIVGIYCSWGFFLLLKRAHLDGLLGLSPDRVPRLYARRRAQVTSP